ncbi:1545_t:CDS:2 [Acaulospora morrowiae]|uniref:1545_t:CDS:1 n=1 Tax=Acaulospora morrowiae TaxID=94023 RepID=A0A9N9HPQ5_9GLOM|nr:1545_t:CDS:2 [Acaulospora morrowiae]
MTSNTFSPRFTQCKNGVECSEEEICALDQNTALYECQPKTSVPNETWVIMNGPSMPQWYPPTNRKTFDQACQHPPLSQSIDEYYGNCRNGLFCDKDLNICMKQLDTSEKCESNNQCVSQKCNVVCASIYFNSHKPMVIVISMFALFVVAGLVLFFVINIKRKRRKEGRMTSDGHDRSNATQQLSSGNTSHKTTSVITIDGENIIYVPYFGEQNVANLNQERMGLIFSERTSTTSSQESHTSNVPSIIESSAHQQENKSDVKIEDNSSDNRDSNNQSVLFKDAFDEFPPPPYRRSEAAREVVK